MKDYADQKIVAAAIKQDGMIFSVPRPGRHHDVIRRMARAGLPIPITGEQGFLTSDGEFVGRRLALGIAENAEQVVTKHGSAAELYSEDVW
jgi:hypothetical protein